MEFYRYRATWAWGYDDWTYGAFENLCESFKSMEESMSCFFASALSVDVNDEKFRGIEYEKLEKLPSEELEKLLLYAEKQFKTTSKRLEMLRKEKNNEI